MLSVFFALVVSLLPAFVSAQNTAQCLSAQQYQWTTNSQGKSPCDIAWDLGSICTPGLQIQPLEPDYIYLGPTAAQATQCRCSSVYYSAIAACGYCQGRNNVKWSNYKANCPTVFLTVFPSAIPSTTKVPRWAYLDVSTWDGFNITAARLTAQAGEEGPPPPSSSTGTNTGTSTSTRNTGTQTNDPQTSSSGLKTNTGAIVGGVVGGVVFIGLVGAAVFFLLKRKRKAATQSTYNGVLGDTPTAGNYAAGSYPASMPSPRPYDPNDPSTFPTSENPSYAGYHSPTPPPVMSQYTGTSYQSSFPSSPMPPSRPQYTGAPEL